MSLGIKVEVERDEVTPELQAMPARLSPSAIAAEFGPRGVRLVQRHFRGLGQNKRGWPTTNFWARAAKSTHWERTSVGVDVVVDQIGVRQRLLGGDINPVNAKALTIPAIAEAYGKVAGEFSNLKFGFALDPELGVMRPALVEKKGSASPGNGKSKRGASEATGLVAIFWLAKRVKQRPDPGVMPVEAEWDQVMAEGFAAITARGSAT